MKHGVILTFLDRWYLFCRFLTRHPTFLELSFSYCSTLFRYNYYEIYKEFYIQREPKTSTLKRALNVTIPSTLKRLWTLPFRQPLKRALNDDLSSTLKRALNVDILSTHTYLKLNYLSISLYLSTNYLLKLIQADFTILPSWGAFL